MVSCLLLHAMAVEPGSADDLLDRQNKSLPAPEELLSYTQYLGS